MHTHDAKFSSGVVASVFQNKDTYDCEDKQIDGKKTAVDLKVAV